VGKTAAARDWAKSCGFCRMTSLSASETRARLEWGFRLKQGRDGGCSRLRRIRHEHEPHTKATGSANTNEASSSGRDPAGRAGAVSPRGHYSPEMAGLCRAVQDEGVCREYACGGGPFRGRPLYALIETGIRLSLAFGFHAGPPLSGITLRPASPRGRSQTAISPHYLRGGRRSPAAGWR